MDNAAHVHLLVNHFPIVGAFLAIPVLLLALLLRKERGLLLAGTLLLVVVAASGWFSVQSGEKAMDLLDGQEEAKWAETYQEADVGEHEDRAELAMWFAYPTAVLSILVLAAAHVRPADNPLGRVWIGVVLAAAVATGLAMAWAGNAGGVIMHREIRGDSLDTTKVAPEPAPADGHGDARGDGHGDGGK
jgi:hypothetical protein